jgi:hypothetical protein
VISAAELLSMQQTQQSSLDLTCTINRWARATKDAVGGNTDSFTADGTTTHFRVGDPRAEELAIAGKELEHEHPDVIATFAAAGVGENAPPKVHDTLTNSSDGHTYQVITSYEHKSYETARRFGLRKVT